MHQTHEIAEPRSRRVARRAAMAIAMTMAAGLGGAAVTAATTPSGDGTINACRATVSGQLRVIETDAGQSCQDRLELPISWNQTGEPGPVGPQGPAGPQGPVGPGFTGTAMYARSGRLNPGQTKTIDASCPAGAIVTGGGFSPLVVDFYAEHLVVIEILPLKALSASEVDRYRVRAKNGSNVGFDLNVYALCAN